MSILKDLYAGFLKPGKDFGTNSFKGYLALEHSAELHKEQLLSSLSEEQAHLFKRYCNDRSDMAAMEQERMFIYAFKMGMEFMQEICSE